MELAFEALKSQGKNDVESIIGWMKNAKIIADKASEDIAKHLLGGKEKGKVEFANFKAMLEKFSEQTKMTVEEIHKKLTEQSMKLGIQGASTALAGLFGKKD